MKNKAVAILFIVLTLIAGCSKNTIEPTELATLSPEKTETAPIPTEPEVDTDEVEDDSAETDQELVTEKEVTPTVEESTSEYPASFTWQDMGVIIPPQDQGDLGSCGVFSAVSTVESHLARLSGELIDLSEQYFIEASDDWSADTGVSPMIVLGFFSEHGVMTEATLPYSPGDSQSDSTTYEPEYQFTSTWYPVKLEGKPLDERIEIVKEAVYKNGPISTAINFYADFDAYTNGVYMYDGKSEALGGHWINIVGWVDDETIPTGGYWICKNSFGTEWGEDGFVNIAYDDPSDVDHLVILTIEFPGDGG